MLFVALQKKKKKLREEDMLLTILNFCHGPRLLGNQRTFLPGQSPWPALKLPHT